MMPIGNRHYKGIGVYYRVSIILLDDVVSLYFDENCVYMQVLAISARGTTELK